jgi:hypothetical protein
MNTTKKLALRSETIRTLTPSDLRVVHGGRTTTGGGGAGRGAGYTGDGNPGLGTGAGTGRTHNK